VLAHQPKVTLEEGLEMHYEWMKKQVKMMMAEE